MRFQPDLGHAVGAFGDLVAHHFVLFLGQDDADHLVDGDKTTGMMIGSIYKRFSIIKVFLLSVNELFNLNIKGLLTSLGLVFKTGNHWVMVCGNS